MRKLSRLAAAIGLLLVALSNQAQTFTGTNAPGAGSNFTFSVAGGGTNLSLLLSNTATSWSYLLLKRGGTPTDTDFDFISRLDGATNQIDLELPEFVAGTSYGLRVLTPSASAQNVFTVLLTTNRTDLRSGRYPVLKPVQFSASGSLTAGGSGAWHYFQVDVPANLASGWRLVLSSAGAGNPDLYLRRGQLPTQFAYDRPSVSQSVDTITLLPTDALSGTWFIGVYLPAGAPGDATYTLTTELSTLRDLSWDPGASCGGDVWFNNASQTGGDYYFRIRPQTATNNAWRTFLQVSGGEADLYLAQGWLPTVSSFNYSSANLGPDEVVLLNSQFDTNQDWYVLVHATPGAQWSLITGNIFVQPLAWDPGVSPYGSVVFTNQCAAGLNFFFKVTAQNTTVGAWRTALHVNSGEADLYLAQGSVPSPNYSMFASLRTGSDGVVLHSSQYTPGQEWVLLVHATGAAQWDLVTGEAYVCDLGALAPDDSSSTNVTMGAEGMAFFKTTIDVNTLAWSLWLHGATNELRARKSAVPHPVSYIGGEPPAQAGQMLVVPDYLAGGTFNGFYFVCVPGTPGQSVWLDSRKQAVTDIAFGSTNATVQVTNWGYRTFRVQVPVQQIAWQLSVQPVSGDPNFAVRRDKVPSEWNNDAFSEVAAPVIDSLTLVPPALSDGTFFITVYGSAPYSFILQSQNPVITDVPFLGASTNDDLNRVGWRFYRVPDINSQLGYLGWDLLLQGAPAGTEIALRRNAVPGRWNYRTGNGTWVNSSGYVDFSSGNGELQRPGHQADIWYIGLYNPSNPLNAFRLIRQPLVPQPIAFDGATVSQTNLPAGQWAFYRVDAPATAQGWDVRLVNVTAGSPQLSVRRDLLPADLNGTYPFGSGAQPWVSTNWPSGSAWAAGQDWTEDDYGTDGSNERGRILAMGLGNPLESGTYYVGVYGGNANSSYTLQTRGIGTGLSVQPTDLAFAGGNLTNTLPAREAAYYRVQVPTGVRGWKVRLRSLSGEVLLVAQKDTPPNVGAGRGQNYWYGRPPAVTLNDRGGLRMAKAGDEQYVLLPDGSASQTNLAAGTYYLAVVSEGQSPQLVNGWQAEIGTGSSTYAVSSLGPLPIIDLGSLGPYGSVDLVASNTLAGGETAAFQFTVPPNVATVEVRLEDRAGNPALALRSGSQMPAGPDGDLGYGCDGGYNSDTLRNPNILTIANPSNGVYSVLVQATHDPNNGASYPDASGTLRVRSVPPTLVSFDGGSSSVAAQGSNTWRFFQINVPASALGWDVRLANVSAGSPRLVLRRDLLPGDLNTTFPFGSGGMTWLSTTWPSGSTWAASQDWTEDDYGVSGNDERNRVVAAGLGNPLEAGTYFVGVYAPGSDCSYTLQSRGIGDGLTLPASDLAFTGGNVTNTLPAREAAYYRVQIPAGTPGWKVTLSAQSGEVLLVAQKDTPPNVGVGRGPGYWYPRPPAITPSLRGGLRMTKSGDEQYVLLPDEQLGQTTLAAGTYYLAVVSEGQGPTNIYGAQRIGTGSSTYALLSQGSLPVVNLGTVGSYGSADLISSNHLAGGETAAYQFTVPPNTATIEVRLMDRAGTPSMALRSGAQLPNSPEFYNSSYGCDGGYGSGTRYDPAILTVANPSNGVYSLLVQAIHSPTDGTLYADAVYTLHVRAVPPALVNFDGGASVVVNQGSNTWNFFQVNVPATALGWDLRLINVIAGSPRLSVRRDLLPADLNNSFPFGAGPMPWISTNWPSGAAWAAAQDWTDDDYGLDGTDATGRLLAMGLGNPLEAGTYYVGVFAGTTNCSYTLQSRGIGNGLSLPMGDLAFAGGNLTNTLPAREAAYYRVQVPANMPGWKVRVRALSGEVLLVAQKDTPPNVGVGRGQGYWYGRPPAVTPNFRGGLRMAKAGDEQYVLLPDGQAGETNLSAGTYYLAVVSEGQNPHLVSGWQSQIGTGSSTYAVTSLGPLPIIDLGALGPYGSADLLASNTLAGGETVAYQFTVPPASGAVEVRLENRVGNPGMALRIGSQLPTSPDANYLYGCDGGYNYNPNVALALNLITLPNPNAGVYSLLVQAIRDGTYPDASATLRVRTLPVPTLNFGAGQNTNGLSNSASGMLADNQRAFFRVQVPATNSDGTAIVGWRLDLAITQGSASVRVRKDLLPVDDAYTGTSPYSTPSAFLVPPYLVPGTWYVEVRASGATSFSLTSETLTPKRLWVMPEPGHPTSTPGLSGLEFGDSGTDTNGLPILDPQTGTVTDQGIDLGQGRFDYYAILVPTNNAGAFRTTLAAISGNLALFIRAGMPPTLSHGLDPLYPYGTLYQRSQSGSTTAYANWVPIDGKVETSLAPGIWYLAVQASGNSNARYRLHIAQPNIQDLSLAGGSFSGQLLNGGDWCYYRVQIPPNPPSNWQVTFGQAAGDVVLYFRDTLPPGYGAADWDCRDWQGDYKNHGPYVNLDTPATYTLKEPPLRPGHTYYLGFHARNDANFSVSSSVSGSVAITNSIAFYGGSVTNVLPANGAAIFRINVPPDGARWKSYAAHDAGIELYLEQGTFPIPGWFTAHLGSPWSNDSAWNYSLLNANPWPWVPNEAYFLLVTNTSAAPASFTFTMDGRNLGTDDENNDGLPDFWQTLYFGYYWNWDATPTGDPDGDGLTNLQEYQHDTDPTNPNTRGAFVSVTRSPGSPAQIVIQAEANVHYILLASNDLLSWSAVTSFTGGAGQVTLIDNAAASQGKRFYRIMLAQ